MGGSGLSGGRTMAVADSSLLPARLPRGANPKAASSQLPREALRREVASELESIDANRLRMLKSSSELSKDAFRFLGGGGRAGDKDELASNALTPMVQVSSDVWLAASPPPPPPPNATASPIEPNDSRRVRLCSMDGALEDVVESFES